MNNQERQWMKACKAGDKQAFTALFRAYSRRVYYLALSITQNEFEAEEVVQEVFLRLWEKRGHLQEPFSVSGFLFTVTKNYLCNRFRKKRQERYYCNYFRQHAHSAINVTEEEVHFREMERRIQRAVSGLPPRRKYVFLLSREKNMTYNEIAKKLDISVKTVENQMVVALRHMRANLCTKA